ncbi:MAG: methyltransferase domain-containing protein [Desulfobacteraceae bacterium]|nr:MAG: methyltransferase domain-containing protein [Desulfobacteraceae bacterium]
MKEELIPYLTCPSCLPEQGDLVSHAVEKTVSDILQGFLECRLCRRRYTVDKGVATLLAKDCCAEKSIYEQPKMMASYLWSHYSDCWNDPESSSAYNEWAGLLGEISGLSLDAGCSVGRFTFEMGKRSCLSVGVDMSRAFVEKARELCMGGSVKVRLPMEGLLEDEIEVALPDHLCSGRVEFIVGDVTALPFKSGIFNTIASLNVIDKVSLPLAHLKEIDRVAAPKNAQLLFSDPFSWSSQISPPQNWLGGNTGGKFSGYAISNIASLLVGDIPSGIAPWRIENRGSVWWKIRTHRNHFEHIRSLYLKAVRP